MIKQNLAPIRYIDPCKWQDDDETFGTEEYPHNPNGSPMGIAAISSPDGRHLAMMPHPERSWLNWQLPWMPPSSIMEDNENYSPWFRLFQNAYAFSVAQMEKDYGER